MKEITENDTIIYLNLTKENNTNEEIPAKISDIRDTPIMEIPSEYALSVVRFSVPSFSIPLFVFRDDAYYITLRHNGVDFQRVVIFDPGEPTFAWKSQFVFGIYNFLRMINATFKAAFDDLKAAFPAAPQTVAPLAMYDPNNQLFSIKVQETYTEATSGADRIDMYFNDDLCIKFNAFPVLFLNLPNRKEWQVILENLGNNLVGTDVIMTQVRKAFSSLYDITGIVLTSNQIPIRSELLNSGRSFIPILTDFVISSDGPLADRIIYIPSAEFRMVDLIGGVPLKNIDISLFWIGRGGELYPILLAPGENLSVKVLFIRKKFMIK